jgi:hypothetical protein
VDKHNLSEETAVGGDYALLVYAAIFVISAQYFQRTDFARNLLGIVAIVTFFIHWHMMFLFQSAIEKFRARLYWIYRTYFNGEEQAGLDLPVGPEPFWVQWQVTGGLSSSHSWAFIHPIPSAGLGASKIEGSFADIPQYRAFNFFGGSHRG